jgi:hypothetical protein
MFEWEKGDVQLIVQIGLVNAPEDTW